MYVIYVLEHTVFNLQSPDGRYTMNLTQAHDMCEEHGSVLASYEQLVLAHNEGSSIFIFNLR